MLELVGHVDSGICRTAAGIVDSRKDIKEKLPLN